MDIRINTITLHNFKGVRDLTVDLAGSSAEIAGRNGAGKSTIFDAFTWLLFGKDHRGQDWTNFDIKPLDPASGEALHHLEHWVEAQLVIDHTPKTLRREIRENWVKPRGQAEEVMKGHTQAFAIDGVPCSTKRDYDTAVANWLPERVFKVITNPLYLIDDRYTGWQERRDVVFSLAGGIDLDRVRAPFAKLLAEASGEPLDAFRRRLAADRKTCKERLETCRSNINAWTEALPEAPDMEQVKAERAKLDAALDSQMTDIRRQLSEVDAAVLSARDAGKAQRNLAKAAWAAVDEVKRKMALMVRQARDRSEHNRQDIIKGLEERWRAASGKATNLGLDITVADRDVQLAAAAVDSLQKKLTDLGGRYKRERAAAFETPDVCSECGRPFSPEDIERLRSEFTAGVSASLQQIVQAASDTKAEIAAKRETLAAAEARLSDLRLQLDGAGKEASDLRGELDAALGDVNGPAIAEAGVKDGAEYQDLEVRLEALTKDAEALDDKATGDTAALLARRRELEERQKEAMAAHAKGMEPLLAAEAVGKERDRLQSMIDDAEKSARAAADNLARLERLEFEAEGLLKAEVEAQTEAVNALFRVARWKMFDYTLDGGAVEMCEVTSRDGVPYRSMNDAMRVQVGMDVIRAVGKVNGITAPIFIDNAESVLQDEFDTPAQVIRLVVADKDLEIIKK